MKKVALKYKDVEEHIGKPKVPEALKRKVDRFNQECLSCKEYEWKKSETDPNCQLGWCRAIQDSCKYRNCSKIGYIKKQK